MSIDSAKAFIERMKTDSEFAGKVAACADAEARMTLVKAAGFDFTAQEIGGLRQELTDQDLGGVAAAGISAVIAPPDGWSPSGLLGPRHDDSLWKSIGQ